MYVHERKLIKYIAKLSCSIRYALYILGLTWHEAMNLVCCVVVVSRLYNNCSWQPFCITWFLHILSEADTRDEQNGIKYKLIGARMAQLWLFIQLLVNKWWLDRRIFTFGHSVFLWSCQRLSNLTSFNGNFIVSN